MKINRIKTANVQKIEFTETEILLPVSRINFYNEEEESFDLEISKIGDFDLSIDFFSKISEGDFICFDIIFAKEYKIDTHRLEIREDEYLKENIKSLAKIINILEENI